MASDQDDSLGPKNEADDDNLFLAPSKEASAEAGSDAASENKPTLRLIIATADAVIGNQFRRQLRRIDDALDISLVATIEAVIDTLEDHPKLLLVDPQLLGADGAFALPQIRDAAPEASILLLPCGAHDLRRSIADLIVLYGLKCLDDIESVSDREGLASAVATARETAAPKKSYSPRERLSAEEVRAGLDADALMLFYQPQVRISDGSLIGFEALARWRKDGQILGPDAFIHTAENEGLIHDLTRIVVTTAAEQLGDWLLDGRSTHISVNVTADDLEDPSFVPFVRRTVEAAGVPPSQLVIEVTERRLAHNMQQNQQSLTALKMAGFPLAIDDYGTGYSSLEQLHRMPLDELKIDRAFVNEAWKIEERKVILNSSVAMGRQLGLRVVAEGVETEQEWSLLGALHATAAQGYFIGKPMPASEIEAWEADWEQRKPDPVPEGDDALFRLGGDIRKTQKMVHVGLAADARALSPHVKSAIPADLAAAQSAFSAEAGDAQGPDDSGSKPGSPSAGALMHGGLNGPGVEQVPDPVVAKTVLDHIKSGIVNKWTIWGGALVLMLEVVLVSMNFWGAVKDQDKLPTLADSQTMAVAVLPFQVADGASNVEKGWSTSLANELIGLLAKSGGVQVAGRSSSLAYLDSGVSAIKYGKRLGVDAVLEGSISSENGEVVLTADLTDVKEGLVLWSDSMRAPPDGFSLVWLRNDVAREIARQLKFSLDEAEVSKTEIAGPRLEAYELYLKGRRLMNSDRGLAQSLLQEALIGDPGLASAHALLARLELQMTDAPGHYGANRFEDRRRLIRSHVDKALELDSKNAEAWHARGLLVLAEGNPIEADEWFKRAIEIDSTLSVAHYERVVGLWVRGQLTEAIDAAEKFRTRDALNVANIGNLVSMYIYAGRTEEADALLVALDDMIDGEVEARLQEAIISHARGNIQQAITALESGRELDPTDRRFAGVSELVYLSAGRFDLVLEQDARWHHGRALVGAGRDGEAREYVNQALSNRANDPTIIEDWLYVHNLQERHNMIRIVAMQRWPDPKQAIDTFGYLYMPSPVHLVAAAFHPQDENGNMIQLPNEQQRYRRDLMQLWKARLQSLEQNGWAGPLSDFERAHYEVLTGNGDEGVRLLQRARAGGLNDPFLDRYPSFASVRARPSFRALVGDQQQASLDPETAAPANPTNSLDPNQ